MLNLHADINFIYLQCINEDAGGSEVVGDGCVGGVFGVTGEGTVGVPPVWLTV
jgi:hypothetical protein